METKNQFHKFISQIEEKRLLDKQESLILDNNNEILFGAGSTNRICSNSGSSCDGSINRTCTNKSSSSCDSSLNRRKCEVSLV